MISGGHGGLANGQQTLLVSTPANRIFQWFGGLEMVLRDRQLLHHVPVDIEDLD
jgi:hypothetical protein